MVPIIGALIAAVAAAVALGSSGVAQDAGLQRSVDRGKLMYLYDRAAWVTSDDAVARIPPSRQAEVGGWVVTSTPAGFHVDYFGKDTAADRVVYSADVNGGKVTNATVFTGTGEPTLKDPALQMARALRAARTEVARHADWHPCTKAPFNTVVLQRQTDGIIPVYFLTPQTDMDSFPMGGHYEVDIAPNGTTAHTRSFTNGCLTISKPSLSAGAVPAALFVTHILDRHPTEIHVFEQYYIGLPLFVGIGPKTVWKIEGGTVEDVSAMMAK